MNQSSKPILVTGSHRSGTTWVGEMLASSPNLVYIGEPFNPKNYCPEICRAHFDCWFTYIIESNEAHYYISIKDLLDFRYNFLKGFRNIKSVGGILHISKEYFKFLHRRYISYPLCFIAKRIGDNTLYPIKS